MSEPVDVQAERLRELAAAADRAEANEAREHRGFVLDYTRERKDLNAELEPQTVLGLLDRLQAAETERDEWRPTAETLQVDRPAPETTP